MSYRFMRMIIFFDLPNTTKAENREYTHFVKNIKKLGFSMFQESVYTKLCLNESVSNATERDLKQILPKDGFVSLLTLTEVQFNSIKNLVGELDTDVVLNDDRFIKL